MSSLQNTGRNNSQQIIPRPYPFPSPSLYTNLKCSTPAGSPSRRPAYLVQTYSYEHAALFPSPPKQGKSSPPCKTQTRNQKTFQTTFKDFCFPGFCTRPSRYLSLKTSVPYPRPGKKKFHYSPPAVRCCFFPLGSVAGLGNATPLRHSFRQEGKFPRRGSVIRLIASEVTREAHDPVFLSARCKRSLRHEGKIPLLLVSHFDSPSLPRKALKLTLLKG